MINHKMIHIELYQNYHSTKKALKYYIISIICLMLPCLLVKNSNDILIYIFCIMGLSTAIFGYGYLRCVLNKNKAIDDLKNNNITSIQSANIEFNLICSLYETGSISFDITNLVDHNITIKATDKEITIPISDCQKYLFDKLHASVSKEEYISLSFDHCNFTLIDQTKKEQIEGYFTKEKREKIENLIKVLRKENYNLCLRYFSKSKVLYEISITQGREIPDHIIDWVDEINDMI